MPISREFAFEEIEDTDLFGLRPLWMDNADASTGRGVAHDMLEHFATRESALESEFQALGALYLLRYECGAQPAWGGTIAQAMANIISPVLVEACQLDFLALPRVKSVRKLEMLPVEAITKAVDLAFERMHKVLAQRDYTDEAGDARPVEDVVACRERVIAWILFGYRKAVRRYAETDPYWVGGQLFASIAKQVDALLRCELLVPGARVRVSAPPAVGRTVTVRVRQPGMRTWVNADRFH
jgi:hypothetical protein